MEDVVGFHRLTVNPIWPTEFPVVTCAPTNM